MDEFVETTQSSNGFMAWPEVEMISVAENRFHSNFYQLFRRKGFDGSLGPDG
jgi:hypothetical protein